ncbi:MAG: aminotransferase class V-fold PLP-dependent enzyme [Ilumatobacteraceae bacterium]
MHSHDAATEALTEAIVDYSVDRVRMNPPPLDRANTLAELQAAAGDTITAEGMGGLAALQLFQDVLAPATISTDHPAFLSFVPAAPTEASILFDLVVGASSIYAGSWMEGAGAVFAENQALRWIADLVGLPESAGGVFVSGGTNGNLSALIAARFNWRHKTAGRNDRVRGLIIASTGSHSSITSAARAMDADILRVRADERGRLHGDALRELIDGLAPEDRDRIFAVVATAGTTNAGVIDDLEGAGRIAEELGVWFHVDGAYGGAALCSPTARPKFAGIERCDSFIVDPHKWLFAPFDCCALVYRNPENARAAHTQHAEYLDVLHGDHDREEWNPSDYAHHLSRRARGLPFWFSLATYGTDAYASAMDTTLAVTVGVADLIRASDHLDLLLEPDLSIVLFRRVGWTPAQYQAWSDQSLLDGVSFVVPTAWNNETVLRFCFVNPLTTIDQVAEILESMQ